MLNINSTLSTFGYHVIVLKRMIEDNKDFHDVVLAANFFLILVMQKHQLLSLKYISF